MDKNKVDMYLTGSSQYFESSAIPMIRQKLEKADDDALANLQAVNMKNPNTILLVSIFLGCFGIDRFMIGDTGMGILKLLTGGCCCILTIYDWFLISSKAKQKNLANISMVL